MDDFAERICVKRYAAVVAVFGFEAARVPPDVGYTAFLQQAHDFLERSFDRRFAFERRAVDRHVAVFTAVKRPYDTVDYVVAGTPREADTILVDTAFAEAGDHRAQLLRCRTKCVEKITNGGSHRVRTHPFVRIPASRIVRVRKQAFEFAAGQGDRQVRAALGRPLLDALATLDPAAVFLFLPSEQRRAGGCGDDGEQEARVGQDRRGFRQVAEAELGGCWVIAA